MTFWQWLDKYKTRLTGFILVTVSALQAQETVLHELISPRAFSFTTLVIGIIVAGIGFLNASKEVP